MERIRKYIQPIVIFMSAQKYNSQPLLPIYIYY